MASRQTWLAQRLTAGALALGVAVTPVASAAESLTDAFILAYRHSGLLEQNRALLRAADEGVAVAISALRPVINYSISSTASGNNAAPDFSNLSNSASITADLTLWDGGESQLAVDAAKESVLATREALINVEQQVLNTAASAYLAVLNDSSIVDIRVSNVQLIERELQAARDRFEVGEITSTDVSIAETALASARSSLASARGDLEVAREQYRNAIGQLPGSLSFPTNLPAIPSTSQAALSVAEQRHPSIRQAMRDVTVAEINVARSRAGMRPTLAARGALTFDEELDYGTSLGVTLSGPIYQGGRLTALVRQAQAQRDASRAALHLARHEVEQALRIAWSNLSVADVNVSASREQVRSATLAFRGVQEEAKLGARTTLDVLNAEQELLDARAAEVTARTQRIQAVYSLLLSMGLLTVDDLQLGITTYDPAAYYNAVKSAPTSYVSPQWEKLDRVLRSINR